jgi:hypothetical protein
MAHLCTKYLSTSVCKKWQTASSPSRPTWGVASLRQTTGVAAFPSKGTVNVMHTTWYVNIPHIGPTYAALWCFVIPNATHLFGRWSGETGGNVWVWGQSFGVIVQGATVWGQYLI